MDYSKTVNLPQTEFPMRASLPAREPEFAKFWEENEIYKKALDKASKGQFILHDGPPYSNGNIHMGHAYNKVLKDIINRYKLLQGYRADYYPGWDNHGLPIENKVSAIFAKKKVHPTPVEMRKACREYAKEQIEGQKKDFMRLGIFAHWDNPYLTMKTQYEATIVKIFGELVEKGYIYRGLKPIHWCINDATALAEAEIEYADVTSTSIYVRFPLLKDEKNILSADKPVYTIIWTTTPWTIPSNMAVCLHPEYEYAMVETDECMYVLAKELVEKSFGIMGIENYKTVKTLVGNELEGVEFKHPFYDRPSPVVFADYVTLEDGTGVVHTAPGHGKDDFITGKRYGIEILNPVNDYGCYTDEAPGFEGMHVFKQGNQAVLDKLTEIGALLKATDITHSYPHCWRCHKPVIFRTTTQWFMSLDHENLREEILKCLDDVNFFPKESKNRLVSMIAGSPDWCLSRQRSWGVGIPVFYCEECGEPVLDKNLIDKVYEDALVNGSDGWYEKDVSEFLPVGFKCGKCGCDRFRKETDVLDVWFDSGSSCHAVLDNFDHLSYPADVYLEGSDQHRGWFNKSVIVGVATTGESPFKNLISHGFVLYAKGEKMSKSKGNTVNPQDVIKDMGADVLRLYIASCDYSDDTVFAKEMLKNASDSYRKIRNTIRFILGNLYDFDPKKDMVAYEEMTEVDKFALGELNKLIREVTEGYEGYEFHKVYRPIQNFVTQIMSSLYLDILKDRLYSSGKDWLVRRSAQSAMYIILKAFDIILSPIIPYTAEEVWQFMGEEGSVFLQDFPVPDSKFDNEEVSGKWAVIREVRDVANAVLEQAKKDKVIGKPMEAKLVITAPKETIDILKSCGKDLEEYFIVSKIDFAEGDLAVKAEKAQGEKCERCWLIKEDVGADGLCERCRKAVK